MQEAEYRREQAMQRVTADRARGKISAMSTKHGSVKNSRWRIEHEHFTEIFLKMINSSAVSESTSVLRIITTIADWLIVINQRSISKGKFPT
jgi:uncharacterized secreted protein with C-terminal beta-propeller domain